MRYVRFRYRRHRFTSLLEINRALAECIERINDRRHTRFGISRRERFQSDNQSRSSCDWNAWSSTRAAATVMAGVSRSMRTSRRPRKRTTRRHRRSCCHGRTGKPHPRQRYLRHWDVRIEASPTHTPRLFAALRRVGLRRRHRAQHVSIAALANWRSSATGSSHATGRQRKSSQSRPARGDPKHYTRLRTPFIRDRRTNP